MRLKRTNHPRSFPKFVADDDEWDRFKQDSFAQFVREIKDIDAAGIALSERQTRLRALRREHHVLVVADRIRRKFRSTSEAVPFDLKRLAELVIDKVQLLDNPAGARRTPEEERYLTSARVGWHKLIKLAGVRPVERRRNPPARKPHKRKTIRKAQLGPRERGEILRRYLADHLQHLVAISEDASRPTDPPLPREDRLLVRELRMLLQRAQRESRI